MHHTPWLLVTSLTHHRGAGTRIKRIYTQRMPIEETRFAEIEEREQSILAPVGDKGTRSEAWHAVSVKGTFTGNQEEVAPYAEYGWLGTVEDWCSRQGTDRAVRSREVVDSDTLQFYQAAAIYCTFVLRDRLPIHGLAVN